MKTEVSKAEGSPAGSTTLPVTAADATPSRITPEFIRLSKPGTLCPHSGLGRSKMNMLILPCPENDYKPPVASKVLRQRGNVRGVRLIVYDSLMSYLRGLDGPEVAVSEREEVGR